MITNISIIKSLKRIIESKTFKTRSRLKKTHFTRNRKLTFIRLIYFLLNLIKKSMQLEIDNFMELIEGGNMDYSKQALSDARQKLKPEAFDELNEALLLQKYLYGNEKKYKNYRLLAIDGSSVELPKTKELKDEYGEYKDKKKNIDIVLARTSMLYDVENNLIIDGILSNYSVSERTMAKQHLEKYLELKSSINDTEKDLIIFDRGYPSLNLISFMKNRELDFIMRVSKSFLKEVNKITSKKGVQDEIVDIKITKSRLKNLKSKEDIITNSRLKIRVLKIKLESGEYEYLITSLLDKEEIKRDSFKELYFKRWGIETAYDKLKNTLEIENFTGKKSIIIKQDFKISLLINNISSLMIEDAQKEIEKEMKHKNTKYKYKVNRNLAMGYVKDRFIKILLEENDRKVNKAYKKIVKKIKKNKIPIRKGRKFSREKKHRRKFSLRGKGIL